MPKSQITQNNPKKKKKILEQKQSEPKVVRKDNKTYEKEADEYQDQAP